MHAYIGYLISILYLFKMASKMAASVWADLRNCVTSWILCQFSFVLHHFNYFYDLSKLLPDNVKQYLAR